MATTNLGRVAIVPQGAYSAAVEYKKLDLVNGVGGAYLYVNDTPSIGTTLTDTDYWQHIVGNGITSILRTTGDGSPGTTDTYTITYTDATTATFDIHNGEDTSDALANSLLWRKTASANPVSVYPVPESPLYLKVSGTFTQEGTGDPSPSNIRPITPWLESGATVSIVQTDGATITLTAPQEIPAGWMDNEGAGQVTFGKLVLDGVTSGRRVFRVDFDNDIYGGIMQAAGAKGSNLGGINAFSHFNHAESFSVGNAYFVGDWLAMVLTDQNLQTVEAWNAYLAAQYAAGTPVTIYYELATPVSIAPDIAPLTAIPQLDRITPRQNVLTATPATGIELTYAKSPIRESDEIATAIASS